MSVPQANPSADIIEKHLGLAIGQDAYPLIDADEARRRAQAISDEMNHLGFALKLTPWTSRTPNGGISSFPCYQINDPRYDLDKIGPGEKGTFGINGPDISCGDLVKLGRICLLRQQHLSQGWPRGLKQQFLDPQSHLDAVEELNWLSRWRDVNDVRTKVNLFDGSKGTDVDLVFRARSLSICAEVKNRRREWVGIVDGWHSSRRFPSAFDDLIDKFNPVRINGALNVACLSTHLPPDADIEVQAKQFIAKHTEVDAIILWSDHCPTGQGFRKVYGKRRTRDRIENLLAPLAREEAERWFVLKHLGRNSEEGRVLLPNEIAAWASRMA